MTKELKYGMPNIEDASLNLRIFTPAQYTVLVIPETGMVRLFSQEERTRL
jgi:hypothetical protein